MFWHLLMFLLWYYFTNKSAPGSRLEISKIIFLLVGKKFKITEQFTVYRKKSPRPVSNEKFTLPSVNGPLGKHQ